MEDIVAILRNMLQPLLLKDGAILYSSYKTLIDGDIYIMGYNPGGANGNTIEQAIEELPLNNGNAYLDENWNTDRKHYDKGQHPIQKNLTYLFRFLGYELRNVFSSNLIFLRSRGEEGVNYPSEADVCWPVHEHFIQIVSPKVFVVFGNSDSTSPFSYLKEKGENLREEDNISSGNENMIIKSFVADILGNPRLVIGLPHLSRYSIVERIEQCEWVRNKITNFLNP